ncbi:tetratricopeptide repeat protein, partial [Myxococcota bacterium]
SEYEFDESRIPADGLPVKCSTCGHVFKVYSPTELPSGSAAEWMVRQVGGNVFSFRELTTLQRWIVERKVSRDDEISKTGKQWKRLGDIAELATFFQVVDAQQSPPQTFSGHQSSGGFPHSGTGPQPQMAMPGSSSQPQAAMGSPQPMPQMAPGADAGPLMAIPADPRATGPQPQMAMPGDPRATGPQPQMAMPGDPRATGPQPQMAMPGDPRATGPQPQMAMPGDPRATGPQPQMAMPGDPRATGPQPQMMPGDPRATGPQGAAWEGMPQPLPWNQQSGNWQMQTPPVDAYDDDDDLELPSGGATKWVILVVLILMAGGVATTYFLRPGLFRGVYDALGGGVDKAALSAVDSGYQELRRDSYASIDRAVERFEEALAIEAEMLAAKAGLAEAKLARVEYLTEEADALQAKLDTIPEAEREAVKLEIENKRREASQRSEHAFASAKQALTLDPNSLPANRAMADYYRIKKASDRMKPLIEKARQAEPNDPRVSCVLGSSVAGEADDRAIQYFNQALKNAPDMHRARYKLARIHLSRGARDEAQLQIDNILKSVPDHERAKALQKELKSAPEPETPPPAPEKKKELGFEQLMSQAERLRESDRAGKALKLFERASEMMPEDPDVYTGLGWCYVDLEQPGAAISTFKTALRFAPRLSDAHMGMGEAYRMKGDRSKAVKHYQKYLEIMPNGPEAGVARRMIKMLKK